MTSLTYYTFCCVFFLFDIAYLPLLVILEQSGLAFEWLGLYSLNKLICSLKWKALIKWNVRCISGPRFFCCVFYTRWRLHYQWRSWYRVYYMYKRVINLPIVTLICRRCEAPREVGAQGKMGKEKSSLRPSHHPLHPNLPLCKGWGWVRFCQ